MLTDLEGILIPNLVNHFTSKEWDHNIIVDSMSRPYALALRLIKPTPCDFCDFLDFCQMLTVFPLNLHNYLI